MRAPGNAENTKIREIAEPEMKLYSTWSIFLTSEENLILVWIQNRKEKNPAHAENKLLASENSDSDR